MTKFTNFLLILSFLIVSFQNTYNSAKSATTSPTAKAASATKTAPANGNKYTLTPVNSKVEYPDAKLSYEYFSDGTFGFSVNNYQLGQQTSDANSLMCANSAKGQHIHLIFDDQPYSAHYTSVFNATQPDGRYYMMAFLGKSYHESIKTKDAFIAQRVSVKDNSIEGNKFTFDSNHKRKNKEFLIHHLLFDFT